MDGSRFHPEYRSAGAPPVTGYIDPMMAFLGHDYYVGFLSAAAIHGASHQSPMVNQIATPALLRNRYIGRSRVQFIRRAQTAQRATQRHLVPTGRINVSTPEVTVLDLVESPSLGAGISNVATLIGDFMCEEIDVTLDIGPLRRLVSQASPPTTPLRPGQPPRGDCDARWNVNVNIEVEHDL